MFQGGKKDLITYLSRNKPRFELYRLVSKMSQDVLNVIFIPILNSKRREISSGLLLRTRKCVVPESSETAECAKAAKMVLQQGTTSPMSVTC